MGDETWMQSRGGVPRIIPELATKHILGQNVRVKMAGSALSIGTGPRAYDSDRALEQARRVFRDGGFASSSLDEFGAAMAMNRPSLYGAFGDKEALYLRTLERYRDESLDALRATRDPDRPLRRGLPRSTPGRAWRRRSCIPWRFVPARATRARRSRLSRGQAWT